MSDVIIHYGVKGQKWGVRRYQNYDGTYTPRGRNRAYALRTRKDVEKIYSTFSDEDKRLLDVGEDASEYMSPEATAYWVTKRILAKHGDEPVAFFDIIQSPKTGEASVAIGTNANYRGQGYGSKVAARGAAYIEKHMDDFPEVRWGAFNENEASINLAKKNGFSLESKDDSFSTYVKKR